MDASSQGVAYVDPNSSNLAEVVAAELATRRGELVDNGVSLLLTYKAPQWLEQTAGLPPAAVRAYVRQQLAGPECAAFKRPPGSPPPAVPGPSAAPPLGPIAAQLKALIGRSRTAPDAACGLAGNYR